MLLVTLGAALPTSSSMTAQETKSSPRFTLPPGFVIERVADLPLVEHPMMANFDERGRLFVADSAGLNMKAADLLKELPNRIRVLEPADAKGIFRKGGMFADRMSFPQGVLWYRGAAYTASPPSIWKLTDAKNTGKADTRTELVTKFGFTGNAADIHGPFLGPDGRIYWCDGRHGHDIPRADGTLLKGKAARIFRCKPDGSEVEVVCGGGMDNPVEIAFTEEGEPFVTVDILHNLPARNDGIIFAIEGGVYPWHEVAKEFPRTGDLLPAVENLGWVAPSGLTRYRSGGFGKEYRDNLFSAQFNRHRIQRHVVVRDGASFKMKTEDFLTSTDKNFHPTDVLEDADGSLLVVDTGGWFRIGCPTSKIAQPEFKGAIYRIRKSNAALVEDPRGLKLLWDKASASELTERLDDPRFMVRDRAVDELALLGADALPALEDVISAGASADAVRNAVWALTRMEHPGARALVRRALGAGNRSVQLATAHSAGLHRDAKAASTLREMLANPDAAVRRQAATALGRIKDSAAIPELMAAIKDGGDRFLEHALIYALIQIGDAPQTALYLKQPNPRQQRAALIALDQMAGNVLAREQVTPLLKSVDPAVRKATLEVVSRRPGWGADIVELLRGWMRESPLDAGRRESLRDLIQGLSSDGAIQSLVTETLADAKTDASVRLVLLESMAHAPIAKLPEAWIGELGRALENTDALVVLEAASGLRQRGITKFDDALKRIAAQKKALARVRVAALAALDGRAGSLDPALFAFLLERVEDDAEPLQRLKVVRALSRAKLDAPQLQALSTRMATLGPLELPHLLQPFALSSDPEAGLAVATALEKAPGLAGLNAEELRKTFVRYDKTVRDRIDKLVARLEAGAADQKKRLEELLPLLEGGDIELGRNVYYGPKALCATCHSVLGRGGNIGPELSKIGAIRAGRDLLESVVFPNSSFARGFEPWTVETKAGTTATGLLARETADAVVLVTTERQEIRIGREDIERMEPARVSIMPQGLEAVLSREEMRNLLAFMQSLR